MKLLRTIIFTFIIFTTAICCSQAGNNSVNLSHDVTVKKLTDSIWIYTAYYDLPEYGHCPANGLIIINGSHGMMINLPWTNEQTGVIFDWAKKEHKVDIEKVVPTHSHEDCAGGLGEAHKRKAESFSLYKTAEILKNTGKTVPQNWFTDRLYLTCGSIMVELIFPGEGHTADNIIAWIPEKNILFGGCLVKSIDSLTMGNIKEANLKDWAKTLMNVKKYCPSAEIIIPGHGNFGDMDLVDHTMDLLEK